MSTKLKPFNLEAALRGEPVVTRDRRPVTQIARFNVTSIFGLVAVIDGRIEVFSLDGKYRLLNNSDYDLFMATKTVKKEGWVNLYKSDYETISANTSHCHKTKERAEKNSLPNCIATIKIEWEEEV